MLLLFLLFQFYHFLKNDKNNYSFQAIIEIDADKVSESSLETYDLDGLTETGVGFEQAKENFEGMKNDKEKEVSAIKRLVDGDPVNKNPLKYVKIK